MNQIQSLSFQIVNLGGQPRIGNLYKCSLQVEYQNGTCQNYDLPERGLRPSAVERVVQILLKDCFDLPLINSKTPKDGS
jgi:hypothetical protein